MNMEAIIAALLIPFAGTALGIAIQNIPEGAIISMPLRAAGNSRLKAFGIGALSGIVEPIGGALVLLLASVVTPLMPYLLAFAAGAMLYVVIEELVPETAEGKHSNLGTIGFHTYTIEDGDVGTACTHTAQLLFQEHGCHLHTLFSR